MVLRQLTLTALALCTAAQAAASLDFSATPAWRGWTRSDRVTEVEIRLQADRAVRAAIGLDAGRQSVQSDVALEPGKPSRVHLPAPPARTLFVEASGKDLPPARREIALSYAEAPLLATALADGRASIEGFHTVVVGPADLPWTAAAYAAIDALVIDASTLAALETSQREALAEYVASCGRVALSAVETAERLRWQQTAGCRNANIVSADSPQAAAQALQRTLDVRSGSAEALPDPQALLPRSFASWNRIAAMTLVYVAAAALALLLPWVSALFLLPALATVGVLALVQLTPPDDRLALWAEGVAGDGSARYRAVQQFDRAWRGTVAVKLAPLDGARPCRWDQPMRVHFDSTRGRAVSAEFDAQLMRPVALCYAGAMEADRAIAFVKGADDGLGARNDGAAPWPAGLVVYDREVHPLPALGSGGEARLAKGTVPGIEPPLLRMALARTPAGMAGALWPMRSLAGARGEPDAAERSGQWLFVTGQPR